MAKGSGSASAAVKDSCWQVRPVTLHNPDMRRHTLDNAAFSVKTVESQTRDFLQRLNAEPGACLVPGASFLSANAPCIEANVELYMLYMLVHHAKLNAAVFEFTPHIGTS